MFEWEVIIGLFMLLGGFSAVFDHILKEDTVARVRTQIFYWLEQLKNIDNRKVIKGSNSHFVDFFNKLYGKRHFSVKTFVRSCIFSTTGLILSLVVISLLGKNVPYVLGLEDEKGIMVVMTIFSLNLFADYISLIETRIILRIASRSRLLNLIPLLCVDFFLTFTIYYIIAIGFGSMIYSTYFYSGYRNMFSLDEVLKVLFNYFFLIDNGSPYLYSTFFTSVLFYLFILSSLLIRLFLVVRIPILPILRWFSSTKNPIKALVGICAAIVLMVEGIKRLVS